MEQGIQASYACAKVTSEEVASQTSTPGMLQADFTALYNKVLIFKQALCRFYYADQGGQVEYTDPPYPTITLSAIALYTDALSALESYAAANSLTVPT